MKRITASEARRTWFRVLDEVAAGEVVAIDRGGRRILLKREDSPERDKAIPDYSGLLQVPSAERADEWGWEWEGEEEELRFIGDRGAGR